MAGADSGLEAKTIEEHERIRTGFIDACRTLGELDVACFEEPGIDDPRCQDVTKRLQEALGSAPEPAAAPAGGGTGSGYGTGKQKP